jgi:hypothetical protein
VEFTVRLRGSRGVPRPRRRAAIVVLALGAVLAGWGSVVPAGAATPGGRVAPYCAAVARVGDLDLLSDPAPRKVRADLRALLALTRRAARVAPEKIRADAQAAVAAQIRFNAFYVAHGWDPEATNLDPEFVAFANSPELGTVYVRLEEYQARVCRPDPRTKDPLLA